MHLFSGAFMAIGKHVYKTQIDIDITQEQDKFK